MNSIVNLTGLNKILKNRNKQKEVYKSEKQRRGRTFIYFGTNCIII